MKLLVLTPQLPYPPHQGTTLRNYNLLKGLARRHSISLFSMLAADDDPTAPALQALVDELIVAPAPPRPMRRRLRDLLLSPLPDMALRLWSPTAFARLQQHIRRRRPDIIQVEGIEMAPYWLALAQQDKHLPPVVYDAHNAEALLQRRAFLADMRRARRWPAAAYSAVQTWKLQRYEKLLLRKAAAVAAVSEADARHLQMLAGSRRFPMAVVSNGVDLAAYDPTASYPNPYPGPGPHLVFTGKMDFRPNVDGVLWFARHVWPQLHAALPNLNCWIVGKNPHDRLHVLQKQAGITVTGAVPDIQPYIAHADLYIAPLLAGGGTRLKLLEAMAMARPIVATRLAADGLPVADSEQLALADTPTEFAARCLALLHDRAAAVELGRRGRKFVELRYNWQHIVPRLEELYQRLQ